jgi:hypothetical protein
MDDDRASVCSWDAGGARSRRGGGRHPEGAGPGRFDRRLELATTVLLAIAAVATACAAYHQDDTGAPRGSHGGGAVSFTTARAVSSIRSVRSIATGSIRPTAP